MKGGKSARNLRLYGNLLADMGEDEEAESKFTAALEVSPDDEQCIGDLAEFYSSVEVSMQHIERVKGLCEGMKRLCEETV